MTHTAWLQLVTSFAFPSLHFSPLELRLAIHRPMIIIQILVFVVCLSACAGGDSRHSGTRCIQPSLWYPAFGAL
jgi:hypothetical protein